MVNGSGAHAEASSHSSASNDNGSTSSEAHAADNGQSSSSNDNAGTSSAADAGASSDLLKVRPTPRRAATAAVLAKTRHHAARMAATA